MSLEEFADMELADALEREANEKNAMMMAENEDPESEEVLERER